MNGQMNDPIDYSFSVSVSMVAALALCVGCSGAPPSDVIPGLPGDGNANTAKPGPGAPVVDTGPDDPWADKETIPAPAAQTPSTLELPAVERFTLRNGLPVMVIKSSRLPVVSMQLAIKVGEADDPRAKRGVSQLTALMLSRGTRLRSATKIADTIDYVGGSLQANAGLETTLLSCSARANSLRTCTTLLSDIVVNPTFPSGEIDEIRRLLHAQVKQRKNDAGQLAASHFLNALWGDEHPRGWPMSARTIDTIQRGDLVAWHRRWFAPNNAILAVAGDVDVKKLRFELDRVFRWWPRRKVPARSMPEPAAANGLKIRLIDTPGQTQSHIRLGHLGISHKDPAFLDHVVFNHVLGGGGLSSRLLEIIRSERGRAYGASSRFERFLSRGAFFASTFTPSAETMATVQLLIAEWAKMKAKGPTQEEVTDAITHLAGSYGMRFESASDVVGAALAAELHGLGEDHVREYPVRIAKVTRESASKAAAATLDTKNLVVVIVGDARVVGPQLDKMGLPYDKVSHLEPVASWERKGAVAAADPATEKAGRQLLDKALQAKGGAAKLAAVRRMTLSGTGKIVVAGPRPQEIPAKMTRRFSTPDKMRVDLELTFGGQTGVVLTVLNGTKAWNRQPQTGLVELPPEGVTSLANQLWRDQEFILLRHRDKGTRVSALGDRTRDGKTYHAVEVTRADGAVSVTLLLDKKTYLPSFMLYSESGLEAVESYSKYKAVSGVKIAHHRETTSAEGRIIIDITNVKFNEAMPETLFTKPE